jgi:outer membrane protein assembly factor BamB
MYRTCGSVGDIAPTGSGGHARFIGRVGALAVFLGVGVALSLPGVAHADTGDTGSPKDSSSPAHSARDTVHQKSLTSSRASTRKSSDTTSPGKVAAQVSKSAETVAKKLPTPPEVAASVTQAVNGVIDAISGAFTGTHPSLPVEPPSPMALLAAVSRELDNAAAASTSLRVSAQSKVARVTTQLTSLEESAAQTATDIAIAIDGAVSEAASTVGEQLGSIPVVNTMIDWVGNLLPYTTAAIRNSITMIFDHPVEVLFHPFEATAYIATTLLNGVLTDFGIKAALPYADTGWATLHGDPGNRKETDVTVATDYNRWTALQGAAVLAAPTILPNGNIVVTTGLAAGASNLHVLDSEGNIVWESQAWNGKEGVDSAAILNSAIIDTDGNIYVSDGDQLWSFTQDGDVRWVTDLPSGPEENPFKAGSREINCFVTATLTNDGSVFGVTLFGQVVVVNSQTGELAAPIYQIPGDLAPAASTAAPSSMWTGGYVDPEIIDPIWQVAYGGIVRSANTPGVDARTGRIFVAATYTDSAYGALYAFDYIPATPFSEGEITVAFVTQMGPGSGSSPTVSADGKHVYASDNDGVLYSFNTRTGEIEWSVDSNAEAASVAVDKSGNIYVLTRNNVMTSFTSDGENRWNADVSSLLAMMPVSSTLGSPVAVGAGNPTIVNGAVVQSVTFGYNVNLFGQTIFVPVRSALVEFDLETGVALRIIAYTTEGTEGILNIAPNGNIYASIGAITTTSLAPIASILNSMLPAGYTVLTPGGGVNGFTPATET